MPKCTICGKKFSSITALEDHHRTVHRSKHFIAPKVSPSRHFLIPLIITIVIAGAAVGGLIYFSTIHSGGHSSLGDLAMLNQPISSALYENLSGVSFSTLIYVGSKGVTSPSSISPSGPTMNIGGKPTVLYIGAEFCPYCATERWGLVVALSKFGNLSNLEYMISSPSDGNLYTVTFLNSVYSSKYINFVSVENEDRNRNPLQSLNSTEANIWSEFDPNSYPFIYFNGQFEITGYQFNPSIIAGLNWTQIASQVNNPSSTVGKSIDGAANTMIGAICKMDGGAPANVCSQSFARILALNIGIQSATNQLVMLNNFDAMISATCVSYGLSSKTWGKWGGILHDRARERYQT